MKKPFLYFLLFRTLIVLLFFIFLFSSTFSQNTFKGNVLDTVEITATPGRNKSLLYQPASIATLKTTELKRGQGIFLDDAINSNVPGVSMQRRSVSGGQQFNIRGYGNGTRGTRASAAILTARATKCISMAFR